MSKAYTTLIDDIAYAWRGDRSLSPAEQRMIENQINHWYRVAWRRYWWMETMTTLELVPNADGDIELGGRADAIKYVSQEKYDTSSLPLDAEKFFYVTSNKARVYDSCAKGYNMSVATATSIVTTLDTTGTTTTHGWATGDEIVLGIGNAASSTIPTGLSLKTKYFAIVLTTSTFQFATTLANAVAGTYVTLTTAGSGSKWVGLWADLNYVHVRRAAPSLPRASTAAADTVMTDYDGSWITGTNTQDEVFDFAVEFVKQNVVGDMLTGPEKQPLLAGSFRGLAEMAISNELNSRERQDASAHGRVPVKFQPRKRI